MKHKTMLTRNYVKASMWMHVGVELHCASIVKQLTSKRSFSFES